VKKKETWQREEGNPPRGYVMAASGSGTGFGDPEEYRKVIG